MPGFRAARPVTSPTMTSRLDADRAVVVIVEGHSDQLALETLARRYGRNLEAEGIRITPIGGAQAIGRFLGSLHPGDSGVRVAGLCDVGEEEDYVRGLERAGLGAGLTRADMEALGFYVCVLDLEDELIRSLGAGEVERTLNSQGDLRSFRRFQQQPAQRGKRAEEQLRRFLGTHSGRKAKYAQVLVSELDLTRVPRPLKGLLAHLVELDS
jgi:predicted ATP-dependent endonuclease of OLD family